MFVFVFVCLCVCVCCENVRVCVCVCWNVCLFDRLGVCFPLFVCLFVR